MGAGVGTPVGEYVLTTSTRRDTVSHCLIPAASCTWYVMVYVPGDAPAR